MDRVGGPSAQDNPVGTQRTGGRSARVKQAVLDSALVELTETGYANFSLTRVAKRAGVHESTVYRRWPKREDLVIAAAMHFADAGLPVPDTGDLATDLEIVITNIVQLFETSIGRALIALSFSLHAVPDFSQPALAFWRARIETGQAVFERAIARGDWPPDYDRSAAFAELVGPLLARRFLLQEAVTPEVITSRVRSVLALRKDTRRPSNPSGASQRKRVRKR